MKVACIISDVPFPRHDRPGVTAVNVMMHQLLSAVAAKGHNLTLLPVFSRHRKTRELSADEKERFDDYRRSGINVTEPVFPASFLPEVTAGSMVGRAARMLGRWVERGGVEEFYPSLRAAAPVENLLNQLKPDAVLTVWSVEGLAATHNYRGAPRVAYHGDIDPDVRRAQFGHPELFDGAVNRPLWTKVSRRREVGRLEKAHWDLMKRVDCIANITANNAEHYKAMGHPRSVYARNTWIDAGRRAAPAARTTPVKIIGHFGYLDRTGSTFGLNFLLSVLPELEKELSGIDFEVHVIGGGQPAPGIRARLNHPRLRLRGFVPDLDSELAEAAAVMMMNNAGPYQAAFTRHIVSWSLGACLVVHENSRRAIPEIVNEKNALTGSTPAEVARAVGRAVRETDLNHRLRNEGRATYETYFVPAAVAGTLDAELRRCVEGR